MMTGGEYVKRVCLNIEKYQVAQMLDWPFSEPPRIEGQYIVELGRAVLYAVQRVAVQRECVAEYPATWVEAVKERFAPAWFLHRWPVRKKRIDMEVIYPKIALPDHSPVVNLHVVDNISDLWPEDLDA